MNKTMKRGLTLGLSFCSFALINSQLVRAGEHPEHPTKKEHPEHPTKKHAEGSAKSSKSSSITKEELAVAIENFIKSKAADGLYEVKDDKQDKSLNLSLVRVHKERLSQVGPETYFACADLKDKDGTVYDLDFFMKGPNKDNLKVTEVSVHKQEGKERYTWHEHGGMWEKHEIKSHKMEGSGKHKHSSEKDEHPAKKHEHPAKKHEHPEHPQ